MNYNILTHNVSLYIIIYMNCAHIQNKYEKLKHQVMKIIKVSYVNIFI